MNALLVNIKNNESMRLALEFGLELMSDYVMILYILNGMIQIYLKKCVT